MIDADAVYLRDFTTWDRLPVEDLKRLFLILTLCYPAISASLRLAGLLAVKDALPTPLLHRLVQAARPTV